MAPDRRFSYSEHQAAFERLIRGIEREPNAIFAESKLDEYLSQMLRDIVDYLMQKLRKLNPSRGPISFEAVCERLVRAEGYDIIEKNRFDKQEVISTSVVAQPNVRIAIRVWRCQFVHSGEKV